MNPIAESYVKLVLELGERDAGYVDAYYGPQAWKDEAVARHRQLADLHAEAIGLIARLDAIDVARDQTLLEEGCLDPRLGMLLWIGKRSAGNARIDPTSQCIEPLYGH